jgi:Leucine-rich repeat (LRR) protein
LLTSLNLDCLEKLEKVDCENNKLKEIILSDNEALEDLNCCNNELTELDLYDCKGLKSLGCADNPLTELNIPINIVLRECYCDEKTLVRWGEI